MIWIWTTAWIMLILRCAVACGLFTYDCDLRKLHMKNFKIVKSHKLGDQFTFCEISNEACAVIRSETFWKPQIPNYPFQAKRSWWSPNYCLTVLTFTGTKVVTSFAIMGLVWLKWLKNGFTLAVRRVQQFKELWGVLWCFCRTIMLVVDSESQWGQRSSQRNMDG